MKWSAGLELQNESCKFRNFYRTLWFGVNFRLDAILWKFEELEKNLPHYCLPMQLAPITANRDMHFFVR